MKCPEHYVEGSVGFARLFSSHSGVFSDYGTTWADIGALWYYQNAYQNEVNDYNSKLNTFNGLKSTYETKLDEAVTQKADLFAFLATPVEVPSRPEMPSQPYEYSGLSAKLDNFTKASSPDTWKAKKSENKDNVGLTALYDREINPSVSDYKSYNRLSYLYASNDTAATAVQKVGHVFGRLGQGDKTMPDGDKPFIWASTTGVVAHTMIGVYPSNSDDAGISADSKKIYI